MCLQKQLIHSLILMRPIAKSPTNAASSYISMQFQRPSLLTRYNEVPLTLPVYNQSPVNAVKTASPKTEKDYKTEFQKDAVILEQKN